jgi:2-polyprenyl-6-hydroxyphenyl methylase/3-demethylubiquinone-9 3-methyltransferase
MIFCINAINHVYDIEKGFDRLSELCSVNGTIILTVDAHNFAIFKYCARMIPIDILHPHQYDLKEYKSHLETRNFKIRHVQQLKKGFFFNHYLIVAGH